MFSLEQNLEGQLGPQLQRNTVYVDSESSMLKAETLGLEAHNNFFGVAGTPHANSQEECNYSMSALPSPSRNVLEEVIVH